MSLGVPHWLFLGLAYAAGAAVLATAAFALGERAFPTRPFARSTGQSGEWRRRAEIRDYLDSIGEEYVEDGVVEGMHCAFYLPERGVAVTFDAGTYNDLQSTDTYVVFVEHEMRGHHLGQRLPFETPDPGWGRQRADFGSTRSRTRGRRTGQTHAGTSSRSRGRNRGRNRGRDHTKSRANIAAAFQTLGITRDADVAEVKAAYREKVKNVHPDRGGSEEDFARVQEAYATAKQYAD